MNFSDVNRLKPGWGNLVEDFFDSSQGQGLISYVNKRKDEIGEDNVYPPDPLRALTLMSLDEVRVVILGQDPYHGPNQANGLAFSVGEGIKLPPSLRNIFKEIINEYSGEMPSNGDLTYLAKQGVLLLNASLTVEKGQPSSHSRIGWEILTDNLIRAVAKRQRPCVYLLWGSFAQQKRPIIEEISKPSSYLILQSNHPSPLSARRGPVPFIGCGHFKAANNWLEEKGEKPISWLPQENSKQKTEEKQLNLL
ncbi:uracil-DNA glycosylase [Turicimonas muris]|uniref:Uracil-DNA glycosylase n=1 Tax=Turicimonas muris TaxID=1796652 RepID=A0A227KE38_9BURK|nr:uracil-DNA glycosylase [Turicimonas muris]ANU66431.1 uracil-DNA glycosylase [Burkholderiales bacterium YL45]OXE45968.1 uracil-DNA glycosylase [Turicimonas muris]QQQ97580.1 uracil-DNA glycosylase [Turicimonas muris]